MKRSPVGTMAMFLVALSCLVGTRAEAQTPYYPPQTPYYSQQTPYAAAPAYYVPAATPQSGYEAALVGYNTAPVAYSDGNGASCGDGGCKSCKSGHGDCKTCKSGNAACSSCNGSGCGRCKARFGGGLFGPGGNGGAYGAGMQRLGNIGRNNGRGIWTKHGPTGTAANCTPRWFDIDVEFMYLKREDVSRLIPYASSGIGGPTALSTDGLDFKEQPGFRITGNYLIGPGTNLEASYFGSFNWSTSAQATGNNNLYSLISGFGTNPNGGFPETDASILQRLDYASRLNSVEMNVRRRYISPNCRFHSSLLAGARYIVLDENLGYFTNSGSQVNGTMNYRTDTVAQMLGFQIGGDLVMAIVPRVRIGAEIKAGVYSTMNEQRTNITLTGPNAAVFNEAIHKNDVGVAGEAGFYTLVQATERLTFRAGYQMLYLDGVALAVENVNADATFIGGARTAKLNESGSVFYHGFSGGMEWTW